MRSIDYDDLFRHVSVIFQKTFLASGSILENIKMGSDASLEEVRGAARLACIDEFIMGLPDGYDTVLGSLGDRVSGGQRQRIAIARAILKNAPVLVLDEATGAADPESQVQIDGAIRNLCKGKTVIIVAHRLGVVRTCDRVAVVEDGCISAAGTHEQVLAACRYYAKAWKDYEEARTGEAPVRVFSKNKSFYVHVARMAADGILDGCNFGLVYFVIKGVFSGTFTMQGALLMTAAVAAVFALRLAIYCFGYVQGQIGGAQVSRGIRVFLGDKIKRIPLSRFTERSSGDYLNALTVNVSDYEQILTHKTGSIVKNLVLVALICAFTVWMYAPAGWWFLRCFFFSYLASCTHGRRCDASAQARALSRRRTRARSSSRSPECRLCAPTGRAARGIRGLLRACGISPTSAIGTRRR